MEPNEHPDYQDRAALVEQAAHYKREAVRLQAERDMLAIQLEQAEARDRGAELAGLQADVDSYSDIAKDYFAELTVLRERVAKALRALTNLHSSDITRVVSALEVLRGE
jgi:hypothetical protein